MNIGVLLAMCVGGSAFVTVDAGITWLRGFPWQRWRDGLLADSATANLAVAVAGAAVSALAAGWLLRSPVFVPIAAMAGAFAARAASRSQAKLAAQSTRLQQKLLLPQFLDMVLIGVGAGLALRPAIGLATSHAHELVAREWRPIAQDVGGSKSLANWLDDLVRAQPDAPMSRVANHLLIATERGTPLTDALAGLSQEFRAESRRELLEMAARKDVQMMLPVVFGILPSVTVVALYPALTTLSALS